MNGMPPMEGFIRGLVDENQSMEQEVKKQPKAASRNRVVSGEYRYCIYREPVSYFLINISSYTYAL